MSYLLAGCESLGNPPRRSRTAPTPWSRGGLTLITQTETVSMRASNVLIAEHAGETMTVEPNPRETDQVATVVQVEARLARRVALSGTLALRTAFRARDGSTLTRDWYASVGEPKWVALFYLPDAPVAAVTSLTRVQ